MAKEARKRHETAPVSPGERIRTYESESNSNIEKIAAIESEERARLSRGQLLAEAVARFCGSMAFVYLHIFWYGGWIVANSATERLRFDPYPFTFLTLVVSLEAIFLSTFILISQNHETRLAEKRNHLDLQINLLAEQESTKTLELLQRVAREIGIDCADDPETIALLEPVDPEALVKEIIEISQT